MGPIAAAGLCALLEGPKYLALDHFHARHIASEISKIDGVTVAADAVESNIVLIHTGLLLTYTRSCRRCYFDVGIPECLSTIMFVFYCRGKVCIIFGGISKRCRRVGTCYRCSHA